MKPDVSFTQSASSLVTSMALTPSTLKTLTQFLDEGDCVPARTTSSSVDGKTFVNLETLGAWHGGVTTVVTPTSEQHDRAAAAAFEIPVAVPQVAATRAPSRRKESSSSASATASAAASTSSRSRAGRRSAQERHAEERLSPKELSRLRMRRQRNKEAAARCRQRRVDLTNDLQGEVEQCEAERRALEDEIRDLVGQKEELEMLLHSHSAAACRMRQSLAPVDVNAASAAHTSAAVASKPRRPATLSLGSTTTASAASSKAPMMSSGMAIETPSSILVSFGLEGFTPSTTTVSTITSSLFTPMLETPTAILQML